MIKNLCRIICAICLLSVTMQAIAAEKNSFEGYDRAQVANTNYEKMHGKTPMAEEADDPELAATMKKYIYGDLSQQIKLTDMERQLITLVVLTTNQNHKFLKRATEGALALKVTPLQIREALYHVAPYIGFPKVFEALEVTNGVFKELDARDDQLPFFHDVARGFDRISAVNVKLDESAVFRRREV